MAVDRRRCVEFGCRPSALSEPDIPRCEGHMVQYCVDCGRLICEVFLNRGADAPPLIPRRDDAHHVHDEPAGT